MKEHILVSSRTYSQLTELIGKRVHFISDCELVPNFKVWVDVLNINRDAKTNEIIFNTKRTNGKSLTIGSNMKNLRYLI